MRNLLFFLRLTVIVNGCFILSALHEYFHWTFIRDITPTFLVLGLGIGVFLNASANIISAVLLLSGYSQKNLIPKWMIFFNFLVLIAQLIYLFS